LIQTLPSEMILAAKASLMNLPGREGIDDHAAGFEIIF